MSTAPDVTPTTARQTAELAALIVDAMGVHVGRDIHEVSPTLQGNVIITDHQGRPWLLRLIPEADEHDGPEGGGS